MWSTAMSIWGNKSREETKIEINNDDNNLDIKNDSNNDDILIHLNKKSLKISKEINENKNDLNIINKDINKLFKSDSNKKFNVNVSDSLEILLKDDTSKILKFFDSLNGIKPIERKGLEKLLLYIKKDKLTHKLINNKIANYKLCCDDLILAYYSSLSPTNPDIIGCWKKWMIYLDKDPFKDANILKIKSFLETNVWNIGYDNTKKPVWFISTKYYKDTYSNDDCNLASVLFIKSMFCNITKNKCDIVSLRQGCSCYVDLSHWGWNLIGWSKIKHAKDCLVAAPYSLVQVFAANIPTFIILLRNFAAKAIPQKSLNKFVTLSDNNEYFEKYAKKMQTPECAGGFLKISGIKWITDRGYLNINDPIYRKNIN